MSVKVTVPDLKFIASRLSWQCSGKTVSVMLYDPNKARSFRDEIV